MKTATILTIIALVMPATAASLLWTHAHGQKLPLANEAGINTLAAINLSQKKINDLKEFRDKLHILRGNFQNRLFQAEMAPVQDTRILEIRNRLKIEVEDYERLLRQQQKRIHDEEDRESQLIERLSTA